MQTKHVVWMNLLVGMVGVFLTSGCVMETMIVQMEMTRIVTRAPVSTQVGYLQSYKLSIKVKHTRS